MARPERIDLRAFQQELSERLKHKTSAEVGNLRLALESAGTQWLVRLVDTGEVLPVPSMTPVPLTKPWFLGIANVRGALHGVIDLAGFMGSGVARSTVGPLPGSQSRLVLLGSRFVDIRAGLLVDRVLGLRNLADFTAGGDATDASRAWGRRTLTDASGNAWRELDMAGLAADPEFMQVGG